MRHKLPGTIYSHFKPLYNFTFYNLQFNSIHFISLQFIMSHHESKYKYRVEILQMMFVLGEANDPPIETTSLIEDIVRGQVIEILIEANKTCALRGTKSIALEDVIFLIRHDKAKVNRLRTYLSWKDVRKNARDQEGGGPESLIEGDATGGAPPSQTNDSKMLSKHKKLKIRLPWELQFMFTELPIEAGDDSELIDDDEKAATIASLKRLKMADDRTKNMTREEYVHWSECRQASFNYRKAKRFREWAQINQLCDSKPNDDVIDILGFLTFEMVCSLTEEAMEIKKLEERIQEKLNKNNDKDNKPRKRKYLFDKPNDLTNPILPYHVEEAWRRLQSMDFKHRSARGFGGGKIKSKAKLI